MSNIAREVSVCTIIFASSLTLIAATLGARDCRGRRGVSSHHFPLLFCRDRDGGRLHHATFALLPRPPPLSLTHSWAGWMAVAAAAMQAARMPSASFVCPAGFSDSVVKFESVW